MIVLLFECTCRMVLQFRSVSNSVIPAFNSKCLSNEVAKHVRASQETLHALL